MKKMRQIRIPRIDQFGKRTNYKQTFIKENQDFRMKGDNKKQWFKFKDAVQKQTVKDLTQDFHGMTLDEYLKTKK